MMIEDRPNGLPPCLRLVPWLRAFLVDLQWQSRSDGEAEILVALCYFALGRLPYVIGGAPATGDRNLVLVQIDRDGRWPDVLIEYRLSNRLIDVLSLSLSFLDDRDPPPGSWTSPSGGDGGLGPDPRISRCGRQAPWDGFVNRPPPTPRDGHLAVIDRGDGVVDRVFADSAPPIGTSDEIMGSNGASCQHCTDGLCSLGRCDDLLHELRTVPPWPTSATIAPPC